MYKPPFFITTKTGEEDFFPDARSALNYVIANNGNCTILDGYGTTIPASRLKSIVERGEPPVSEKQNKYSVEIHTDGSCFGNPGPGGYAGIIVMGKFERTVKGYDVATTNNRMELRAVIEAMKELKKPCEITVYTDSQYLCTCSKHNDEWFAKEDRPNKTLWYEYLTAKLAGRHHISFVKVPAHKGEHYNERCDEIAKEQARIARHILAGHEVR